MYSKHKCSFVNKTDKILTVFGHLHKPSTKLENYKTEPN